MRVSALRHRVAGEALPGFIDAVSFASRTAGTGTRSQPIPDAGPGKTETPSPKTHNNKALVSSSCGET